eukprot:scaffold3587_cov109-Isochrysis_galbana.AAC.1
MPVEAQSGVARLLFPDGKTARMLNLGILVVPDPVMPVMPVQPIERIELEGIHPSRVSYGGYKRGVDVPAEVLHDRFNHRSRCGALTYARCPRPRQTLPPRGTKS